MINEAVLLTFLVQRVKQKKLSHFEKILGAYIKCSSIRRKKILKEWVGLTIVVYNGRNWIPLIISEKMIGKRIGSFVFSKAILVKKKEKK